MSQVARRSGGSVVLAGPRPCVLQVIQILRLEQLFRVHETVDGALDALERRACA
jgi:anti-anti-sigma regulatory factor